MNKHEVRLKELLENLDEVLMINGKEQEETGTPFLTLVEYSVVNTLVERLEEEAK